MRPDVLPPEPDFREEQRQLIRRDLHDGLVGLVTGITMLSELGLHEQDPRERAEALRKILKLSSEASGEIRGLMQVLEAEEFTWADLVDEVRRYGDQWQERHGIGFRLEATSMGSEDPGLYVGMTLFRLVRVALRGIVDHSLASQVAIGLGRDGDRIRLTIHGDGHGAGGVKAMEGGGGGKTMQRLAKDLGATVEWSGPQGLTVLVPGTGRTLPPCPFAPGMGD